MSPTARSTALFSLMLACVEYRSAPVGAPANVTPVEIVSGLSHTCARMLDGTVRCWGSNAFGQLGDGTTTSRSRPVIVAGVRGAGMLALGEGHTCALVDGGTVRCWGRNPAGQLGANVKDRSLTSVPVQNLESVEAIVAGDDHTCARLQDDTVRCWGLDDEGQLGDGDGGSGFRNTPVPVRGVAGAMPLEGVRSLAAGERHTCAQMMSGGVLCWGLNNVGELGDGTNTARGVPGPPVRLDPLPAIPPLPVIAAGERHGCVVLSDFTVRCWGENGAGQLGNGTAAATRPVEAQGVTMAIVVRAGVAHTCALLDEQTVRCWGSNAEGQLGEVSIAVGSATLRSPGLTGVAEITAGGRHTCARLNNNEVWCWGDNASGQLGDGTLTRRPAPVRVMW